MECDIKYKRWEQRLTHMAMQGRPKKKICIEQTKTHSFVITLSQLCWLAELSMRTEK